MKYTDIITLPVGALGANCYIVPTGDGEAVVIDPGDEGWKIFNSAKAAGLDIKAVLLTHGHFDHMGGTEELKKAIIASLKKDEPKATEEAKAEGTEKAAEGPVIPVYVHESDVELLSSYEKSLAFFCPRKTFIPCVHTDTLVENSPIMLGNVTFTFLHTPGHTAGSVCYLCEDEDGNKLMFSGDTLFKDSIGRSDTYSGNGSVQMISLDKLKALDDAYIVFPGHGESTTLGTEKRFNPFLTDF